VVERSKIVNTVRHVSVGLGHKCGGLEVVSEELAHVELAHVVEGQSTSWQEAGIEVKHSSSSGERGNLLVKSLFECVYAL
jgi:hypothetical protein